jgi:hypothetical protein
LNFVHRTVSIIVGALIACGTYYDVKRNNKRNRKYAKDLHSDSSGLNCTTYDLTGNGTDKKSNCVGIGIPTGLNNNNSDENLAVVIVEEEKLCNFALTFHCSSILRSFFL